MADNEVDYPPWFWELKEARKKLGPFIASDDVFVETFEGRLEKQPIINGGCCLLCPTSEPGCLCYQCRCKKCFWYNNGWVIHYLKIPAEQRCSLAEVNKFHIERLPRVSKKNKLYMPVNLEQWGVY